VLGNELLGKGSVPKEAVLLDIITISMMNSEYFTPHDDIEQSIEREELIDHYLDQRDISYEELIDQLEKHGGKLAFHDSEQLAQLQASFTAGTRVEFSEQHFPSEYQPGVLMEDTFLVPFANIDRQPALYRPHLCATIQDDRGIIDVLLLAVAKRSNGTLEVNGLSLV
jgi:hypothetical protein